MSGLFRLLSSASPSNAVESPLPRVDSIIPENEIVMDASESHIPPAPTMSLPEIPQLSNFEDISTPISSLATLSKDEVIHLLINERFKNTLLEKKVDEVKFHLESREQELETCRKAQISLDIKNKKRRSKITHLEDIIDELDERIKDLKADRVLLSRAVNHLTRVVESQTNELGMWRDDYQCNDYRKEEDYNSPITPPTPIVDLPPPPLAVDENEMITSTPNVSAEFEENTPTWNWQ